MINELILVLYN